MKKHVVKFIMIIMVLFAASSLKITTSKIIVKSSMSLTAEPDVPYFDNVVLITWDGTNAEWYSKLIHDDTLVNSQRVLENGFEQLVRVTTQPVSTNPCLSTLETGYSPEIHGITRNVFGAGSEKPAIPDGLTTFERLKDSFGSGVKTAAFFPWGNIAFDYTYININPTHWDPIFFNVAKGEEVDYWFSSENLTWVPHDPETDSAVLRPFNEDIGKYPHYLLNADYLGNKAAEWITNNTNERFYLRIHVTEPDQAAPVTTSQYSGRITPEYKESLVTSDRAVGMIYDALESADLLEKTLIIIGADHGMDYDTHGGNPWPALNWARSEMNFVFSNTSVMHALGEMPITQKSISPTVLAAMGVDLSTITPAYIGNDQTGVPLWEFAETDDPSINNVKYQINDEPYEILSDGAKINKIFNISLDMLEWCTEYNATLEIDGTEFDADHITSNKIRWYNVNTTSLSKEAKTLLFTVTDKFGNTSTLEINKVKRTPLSIWVYLSGILVLSSIFFIRKRNKYNRPS